MNFESLVLLIVFTAVLSYRFFGVLVLVVLIWCPDDSTGQALRFTFFDDEPGIQGKGIVSVLQDSEGFLWAGTSVGLARYDGVTFDVFTHNVSDSTSITDNFLGRTALVEDLEGNIWAGTRVGLSRWNRSTGSFTRFYEQPDSTGPAGNNIQALYVAANGTVWVGTMEDGISAFDPETKSFTHFRHDPDDENTLMSDRIIAITGDITGAIWASTPTGLCRYDESLNKFERVLLPPDVVSEPTITTIRGGVDNYLWIGSNSHGLMRYDIFTKVVDIIPTPNGLIPVSAIKQEESGKLWIGAYENGLYTYEPEETPGLRLKNISSYIPPSPEDYVLDIHVDRSGVLWVASWEGLRKGVPVMFKEHKHSEFDGQYFDLSEVQAFFEDDNGDVWAGMRQGGIIKILATNGAVVNLSADPDLPLGQISDGIYSIVRDHEGYLWFATAGAGVYRYNDTSGELQSFKTQRGDPSSLSSNNVYTVMEDLNDQLWMSTADRGINKFDRESQTFKNIDFNENDTEGLSYSSVWPILEDSQGRLWFGTFGGGLNMMVDPDGKFKRFQSQDLAKTTLSNDRIVSLLEASDSTIWIGTMGGGVNHFDPKTESFTSWSLEDRFPSINVICILEDDNKDLWMSTDAGLVLFNPDSEDLITYNGQHGLSNTTFAYGSCMKAKDGTLYFGTSQGFVSFRAEDIRDGDPPNAVITDLEVFDESVPMQRAEDNVASVKLEYNDNTIDIHYAALDYKAPGMNQFSFLLDGYDRDWSSPSIQPFTRYTGLPPGSYTFRVRAADGYGTWAEEEAMLLVSIARPFWFSWWFITSMALIVGLSVLGGTKIRRDRKREVAETKKRIANDLHDDLGSRMAALGLKLESTARIKDRDEQSRRIQLLADRTRGIIQDLRDITRLVEDGGQGNLSEIIETLRKQAHDLLPDHITIHGDFPGSNRDYYVTMLWKHNIVLILSETLSNISQHAEATEVFIKVYIENDHFILHVKDNGIGFDKMSYEPGKGIASLENRAKRLNGNLVIDSSPENGTLVELRAPIKIRN